MSILVEGISVIVKCSAIAANYPGGWNAFARSVPEASLCADRYLARVGFRTPSEAKRFVAELEAHGIIYMEDGKARDLVVADQNRGVPTLCDWADFGQLDWNGDPGKEVTACRLVGSRASLFP